MPSLDVAAILTQRAGEELALNERHLNRQLVRVLRTVGLARSWVGAEGAELIDSDGQRHLDMIGGFGVFSLGRNHPAVRAQLERFLAAHTAALPQLGVTLLAGVLAEALLARAPASVEKVVLTNSGAEAVDTTIKLARAATGRPRILSCHRGFHGLTLAAVSVNGNPEFRERFGPLLPGCELVGFGDLDALERELARGDVAAFLVEPVQGKGIHVAPPGYLEGAQALCRRHGTLLAVDEVQTGLGRTGRFLALEHFDAIEPELILLSKALSGGYVPVGAVLCSRVVFDRVYDRLDRALVHSSTFATGDLAAAAALATLSEIDDSQLVARAARMGGLLRELTEPLVERHEIVREVRSLGLMWALELGEPQSGAGRRVWRAIEQRQPELFAQLIVTRLFAEHRILTQVAAHRVNVVKATPPLVVGEQEIRRFASALDQVLGSLDRVPRAVARFGWRTARQGLAARRPVHDPGAPAPGNGASPRSREPAR